MMRDFRRMIADYRLKAGSRQSAIRILFCFVAVLALAHSGFAQQRYYTKLDHFGKLDNYTKVDGSGGPLADFHNLPVPPIAEKCGHSGVPCSGTGLAVGSAKLSRIGSGRELDQIAKEAKPLKSTDSGEGIGRAGNYKLLAAGPSGPGSGINFSSGGGSHQHTGASSPSGHGTRRR